MFIYLLRILIEKLRDHKSDILRAPGYSVYQFTTDMWQAEVQEVIMGIMQIADQVLNRQAFADILDRRIHFLDQEIHDCQESTSIHPILPANLPDILLSEPERYTKAAHD